MRVEIVVGANQLVVTPEEVRAYLRFGSDSEDAVITRFIQASTHDIEAYTGRTFVETTYKAWTDRYGENLRMPRTPVISVVSAFDADLDAVSYELFNDIIYLPKPTTILYKAGYLRKGVASGGTVTLEAHGYAVDDVVTIDDVQYTVTAVTDDTFDVSGLADGNVLVGLLPSDLKECLIESAANRYLRGSTEEQLSKEIKSRLSRTRVDVGFG